MGTTLHMKNAILTLDPFALSVDQVYDLNELCPTNEEMEMITVVAEQTPELLYFYNDLIHLQDAYWIQIKDLYEEKSTIIHSFEKVKLEFNASVSDGSVSANFRKALRTFLYSADAEVPSLISLFDEVDQCIESLIIYFGEDPNHYSWTQVIKSLVYFIEMFKKAHSNNKMKVDARKKKLEKNIDEE
ncbi:formin-like protein 3 [Lactuca sativa]|uniref:formin-like protein 3 n=1 Tax=Lactuca sativa TaxID=4236 RepID=UPI0022AEED9B|nr:formin-like protein 3 [Lactuca sativa]